METHEETAASVHVLAAKVEQLAQNVTEMRAENRDWRAEQRKIFQSLAENHSALEMAARRIELLEAEVISLSKWKYKSSAVIAALLLLVQLFFNND